MIHSLSQSKIWIKLGVYEQDTHSKSGYVSAINSTEFFLAEAGMNDPLLELRATIKAFKLNASKFNDINQHPVCRFPARAIWLKKVLPKIFESHEDIYCTEFREWSHDDSTDSISIIFASGYLGNPASFYGHTLLKFNSAKNRGKTKLSDVSVNYGALIPENENPVTYIAKGLSGGYDAGFSHINYYYHNHNYGENELRDMWEYELSFNKEESQFVVAHAWELLGKKYTYYFLRKNCAYRMAELLEVVDGIDIKPKNPVYLIPQALVQKLSKTTHTSQPLVKNIKYHPSRQSRFYTFYNKLSQQEKWHVSEIIEKNVEDISNDFELLMPSSKEKIINVVLDYYQYILKMDKSESAPVMQSYDRALALRFLLPVGQQQTEFLDGLPPHEGRKPSLISSAVLHNQYAGNLLAIKLRPAYYDSLDSGSAHIEHSALAMGEFGVRLSESDVYLDYLNFFSVRSVNSKTTGLPNDSGFAWNLKAGLERTESISKSTVFRVQGDIGSSLKVNDSILLISYLGGGVQDKKDGYGSIFVRGILESHLSLSDDIRVVMAFERRALFDTYRKDQNIFSIVGRYQIENNMDFRLYYQDDGHEESGISLGFYW